MLKNKKIAVFIAALFLGIFSLSAYSDSATDQLMSRTLYSTHRVDDLKYLTQAIGGRPTGSAAMAYAMRWGLKEFTAAGISNAHLESYVPALNWLPDIETAQMILPETHEVSTVRIAAMPFSSDTDINGTRAPIYAINAPDASEILLHADQVKNHWLLIPTMPMSTLEDLFKEYLQMPAILSAAQQSQAIGILWMSNRPKELLYRHNLSLNSQLFSMPGAVIAREPAEHIIQLLQTGHTVELNVTINNIVQNNPVNYNVVAEIEGRDKPDEVIIFGAHLDSWDLGQGAQDNGCNVALVLDAARNMQAMAQAGYQPHRTIRFVLYSGEELGLYGSTFDVINHFNELKRIKAAVIIDTGSGKITGFSLGGREDMVSLTNDMLAPVRPLGPFNQTTDAFIGTDNYTYLLAGIPTLVANQDVMNYLPSYHAQNDRFENVDLEQLKSNALITSVLVWNLANTTENIPARQNPNEVRQLLASTGLEQEIKAFNLWDKYLTLEKMERS